MTDVGVVMALLCCGMTDVEVVMVLVLLCSGMTDVGVVMTVVLWNDRCRGCNGSCVVE